MTYLDSISSTSSPACSGEANVYSCVTSSLLTKVRPVLTASPVLVPPWIYRTSTMSLAATVIPYVQRNCGAPTADHAGVHLPLHHPLGALRSIREACQRVLHCLDYTWGHAYASPCRAKFRSVFFPIRSVSGRLFPSLLYRFPARRCFGAT